MQRSEVALEIKNDLPYLDGRVRIRETAGSPIRIRIRCPEIGIPFENSKLLLPQSCTILVSILGHSYLDSDRTLTANVLKILKKKFCLNVE